MQTATYVCVLLVKDTYKGHANDSHYLLQTILDYLHNSPFYMHVTAKVHAGLSLVSIEFSLSCTVASYMRMLYRQL